MVKSNPRFKNILRNIYQDLISLFDFKNRAFVKGNLITKEGFFFGFHDIKPFSYDDSKLLANKIYVNLKMPNSKDKLGVGYFDAELKSYSEFDRTSSWNWHKGCRLQWLNNYKIIYNYKINQKIISKIFDIKSKKFEFINYPIDTISKKFQLASSFNYDRLELLMPGYGYRQHLKKDLEDLNKNPDDDGLFVVNLQTKKRELYISLKQLSQTWEHKYSNDKYDYKIR